MKIPLSLLACALSATLAPGAIVSYNLMGQGGAGLLASNETSAVAGTPGSGGEILGGITFDDVTKILTINVGWTGLQSATAGTPGVATGAHIHGPTAGAPFTTNGSVVVNFLTNSVPTAGTTAGFSAPSFTFSNQATGNGTVSGTVVLNATAEASLAASRLYVNIHSGTNGGGEIRGNIVPVPEPSALAGVALAGMAALRRRRR
jgi:hypothetical protein